MFARFDGNPLMTLRVIKETKRYGRMHAQADNVKTVYPPQTKFAGGIKICRVQAQNCQSRNGSVQNIVVFNSFLTPGKFFKLFCRLLIFFKSTFFENF